MDNRTIVEKRDALTKALQNNESVARLVGLLNELKKGVTAREETLRSTKIGAAVAKAKHHKNPEVVKLASEIVRKWREEVEKQRGGGGAGAAVNGKKGVGSPANLPSPAPSPAGAGAVPPDQRNWKRDKVNTSRTSSDSRNNCIGLLYDGLVHLSTVPAAEVLSVAAAVEAAIFAKHGPEERPEYKAKVRSLFQNLKNKSNPQLRVRVVGGDITPDRFVTMSHEELKSAQRREEDKKLETENMRLAQAPKEEKSVSASLQCSGCGKKKVSYTQAQTRSADEPMTTFCECTHCGKRWKFS